MVMTHHPPERDDTEPNSLWERIDGVDAAITQLEQRLEAQLQPVRRGLSRRFPTLFLFAITFGVTATFFGIEQLLLQFTVLREYPWLILGLGLSLLVITGTLYRKLG